MKINNNESQGPYNVGARPGCGTEQLIQPPDIDEDRLESELRRVFMN